MGIYCKNSEQTIQIQCQGVNNDDMFDLSTIQLQEGENDLLYRIKQDGTLYFSLISSDMDNINTTIAYVQCCRLVKIDNKSLVVNYSIN